MVRQGKVLAANGLRAIVLEQKIADTGTLHHVRISRQENVLMKIVHSDTSMKMLHLPGRILVPQQGNQRSPQSKRLMGMLLPEVQALPQNPHPGAEARVDLNQGEDAEKGVDTLQWL